MPLTGSVAAVSCGIVDGVALLDLDYSEDSTAEVDANVVMTGDGGLVEVQATAERTPLSRAHLDDLLALAAQRDRVAAHAPGRGGRTAAEPSGRCPRSLVLATRNPHKLREFEPAARAGGVAVEPLPDGSTLPPEDGDTFAEPTRCRRRAPRPRQTGRPAIADDSGIEAEALGGGPGVRSARYAGPTRDRRGEPRQADARGAGRQRRCATYARWPTSTRARRPSGSSSATAAAGCRRSREGSAGSATTRRSCPTAISTGGRWPS